VDVGRKDYGTHAICHLFAENKRWMAWSSISVSERRYESMSLPMDVDLSAISDHGVKYTFLNQRRPSVMCVKRLYLIESC
jgi:hypothetical protein